MIVIHKNKIFNLTGNSMVEWAIPDDDKNDRHAMIVSLDISLASVVEIGFESLSKMSEARKKIVESIKIKKSFVEI